MRHKIYQELGFGSLGYRICCRKLIFFHTIILGFKASYLQSYLTPSDNVRTCLTRYAAQKSLKTFRGRTKGFESSFFRHCAKEWESLNKELRNIDSAETFKLSILSFVRSRENSFFQLYKFWHNFNDTIKPMYSCGKEARSTLHYLLCCNFYSIYRPELLYGICALNHSLKNISSRRTFFQD